MSPGRPGAALVGEAAAPNDGSAAVGPPARAHARWPWLLAARPQTLAVGAAPVVLATALAWARGGVLWPVFVCALGGSACIQVGTNLFNDWADAARGADGADRLGPQRVTQAGLLPARQVLAASLGCFVAACGQGVVLLGYGGWRVLAVGLCSVLAGLAYTGGPLPLAYHGLGEPFAFFFFGPVPVLTTYALHGHALDAEAVGWSAALGAFSAAVLLVNNLRDRQSDARVGKNTLAVRLGPRATRCLYGACLGGAYAVAAVLGWRTLAAAGAPGGAPGAWSVWLSLPWAVRAVRGVGRDDGAALNPWLGATARLEAAFAALASLGAVGARLWAPLGPAGAP